MTELKYNEAGLIPAIVQDVGSGRVLMLAYMNSESLQKTKETGETWFFSRSRNQLWHKGVTSGHTQEVVGIRYDCDCDALLVQVKQQGPACHTGAVSCFYRTLPGQEEHLACDFLFELERIIDNRKVQKPEGSYVAGLFAKGLDRILKKVGEEAGEVIIAAKNEDKNELVYEAGDLLFHLLVLLSQKGVSLSEVLAELERRHSQRNEVKK
ncbi:MAG: bifunctional phosphoribosyl-AMP cyclohydrolase/phosphoribosyl-ATP diphosphatase HisIE [Dethiobacter sp.]|jgi:phosphoribosyl-ATP pyrophosphohydrolase/phosphoribosyl-AMP cyclohydrolase|nr:bifunctional phosphoribosyl-AMP cyclohydrolase/phosphoribosyl-ATP diphosphatase HisIE [Dethiobacter sp.]